MRGTTRIDRRPGTQRRLALTARRLAADTSGATAVEYALLVLISIAIATVAFEIGGSVNAMFEKVAGLLAN